MKKRTIAMVLALAMTGAMLLGLSGCGKKSTYTPLPGLDKSQDVTLKIAIPYETNKALNTVANAFMELYPNVNVQLEYVEDYDKNAVQLFKDGKVDIILQKDIKYAEYSETGKTTEDYYYNFADDTEIDFSNTTSDITDNYRYTREAESGEVTYQYCYPLGGETRGFFVNVTMLKSLGCEVPTNYDELVACCETLKQAGYIAIQGHISTLSYGLGIPGAANAAVHDETALAAMSAAQEGLSQYFEDTLSKIYNLSINRYLDYKTVEGTGCFKDISELGQARSFLGLTYAENTLDTVKPENNSGYVAFFPYISSAETVIDDLIEEYGLDTELAFICTPLNDAGTNSPAYITPGYGICANKNSENLIWVREFVNFLFQDDNIKTYADNASLIPNAKDAMQAVSTKYKLNVDTDVTLCGQIKFRSDYNAFTPLGNGVTSVAKSNAPKYMVELKRDESGNILYEVDENGQEFLYLGDGKTKVLKQYIGEEDPAAPGYAFCTLAYYMDSFENEFVKYRVG